MILQVLLFSLIVPSSIHDLRVVINLLHYLIITIITIIITIIIIIIIIISIIGIIIDIILPSLFSFIKVFCLLSFLSKAQ